MGHDIMADLRAEDGHIPDYNRAEAVRRLSGGRYLPPTPKQLTKLNGYIDHPALTAHLDRLSTCISEAMKTRAETWRLIDWAEQVIEEFELTRQ